jgi:O-antigen/teichoic acid export membrane protein
MGVNCALNFIALRQEAAKAGVPLGYASCLQEWAILWRFSVPAVLAGAIAGPVGWATNALLVNQPNGYAQMGVYNAVYRIRVVPEMILSMLLAPLLPVLSEKFSAGDARSFRRATRSAFAIALLATAPAALILIALPAVALLPYGSAYAGHSAVVQWVMADLAIIGVFIPNGQLVASMNRMWFGFIYSLGFALIYLGLSLVLVPTYGAAGLAAAITLSHLLTLGPSLWYLYRIEKTYVVGTGMWELSTSLCVVSLLVALGANWLPAVYSAIFAIAILPALWLLRRVSSA